MSHSTASPAALPAADWADTRQTLHLWTQVVDKTRLALSPMLNHWWQVPLYVMPYGLSTSPMPYAAGSCEVVFTFTGTSCGCTPAPAAGLALELKPPRWPIFNGSEVALAGNRYHSHATPNVYWLPE
ncbi:hypothetical protein IC235_06885 [Hymenobacter sp. BT664]|uniref:Uncharacterized protein n=1 Tax=Hymenobacter montanus TaxID=2771359 RepID=A0A927BCG5_9BACT|nr:DUF5996 family protein [Hymenobacter montanus]MBD2767614.1 hypothetical protein [Hymenobacter montanus]